MIRAEVEELGRMLGLPVLKPPPGAPRGAAFMLGDEFYVRDEWPGELSRMVAEARRLVRGFLTGRIRLAEQRLGLAKDAGEPLFVRVLRALDRSPAALTGRQVAARLQVSPTTGIGCLEHLAELGAVVKERRGRANIWRITDTARRFLVNRAQ